MPVITPNLWFDDDAEEAANYYCSIFPNSRITAISRYTEVGPGPEGSVVTVSFELDGQPYTGINGGPVFSFDEAVSFLINCKDQAEIDHYWDRLIADGGTPSQCGWLKDRFGLSWQVAPADWEDLLQSDDTEAVNRAMTAMLGMSKLDLAALQAAFDGT